MIATPFNDMPVIQPRGVSPVCSRGTTGIGVKDCIAGEEVAVEASVLAEALGCAVTVAVSPEVAEAAGAVNAADPNAKVRAPIPIRLA